MRYIVYGLAIFAAVLAVTFTTGYLPRDATASPNKANADGTVKDRAALKLAI